MTVEPWPDLHSERKAAALDALDAGSPCIPLAPLSSLDVLQNTLGSVLLSSPTPDQAMMACLLYVIGPMSAAEASRLIGRRCAAHDELVKLGAATALGRPKTVDRQAQIRLVGSWAVTALPGRGKSPRPPSIAELRDLVAWAREHAKRCKAEASGELLSILRWVKQSSSGASALPTPRDRLPKGASLKSAMDQLRDWAEADTSEEAPVTAAVSVLSRWIQWTSTEHTHLPEFIPSWPLAERSAP